MPLPDVWGELPRTASPGEVLRTPFLGTGVEMALAGAPFSWFRGGPARSMGHLGAQRAQGTLRYYSVLNRPSAEAPVFPLCYP